MTNYIEKISEYISEEKRTIDSISKEEINTLLNLLVEAKEEGRHIFIMGNGGSAATASHFVCDFNKGISYGKDKRFKFICLNDNVPTMMAYANDTSYFDVFVEPLKNYLEPYDIVIGISGSGNSENVVRAIQYANDNGGITVGITGYSGGKIKQLCKYNVHVPVNNMQITEDMHMMLDHCMMSILYKE